MRQGRQIAYLTITLFLIISTVTFVPVLSQSSYKIDKNEFLLSDDIPKHLNKLHRKEISNFDQTSDLNVPKYISKFLSLIESSTRNQILNNELGRLLPFLNQIDSNLTTVLGILSILTTFGIAFIFGLIAVAFPELLPVFVKYFEIVLAGTVIGIVTDVSIRFYQENYNLLNSMINQALCNQNISSILTNITTTVANITSIPGVIGGISAASGVLTALTFLKLWDLYLIIQMIGGGLFFSFPVIIPVIIYVLYIDIMLNRSVEPTTMEIVQNI
jgi:hypothetical protein